MAHKFISATHNKKTLTAMYKMADGTIYIRKGGKISWRLQNPGNVRPNKSNASEYLQPLRLAIADTASGQFSMFGSEEDGWETKKKLLRSSLYRDCTVSDMAEIYAPKKDGNDPVKYAKEVLAESGVSPSLTMGDMDDATLERVMEAMKKEEGYYNSKETRVEKWVYTTNISVTDGIRPVAGVPFKATLGTCEYSCKTDKYGRLAPIVHKAEGMNIEVKAANAAGEYETAYSAQAGNESKNILLKRNLVQYKAHTLAHNPEPPHEKSQPKPIGYIIQSGDTLSGIAARYEVSVSELTENNGIKDPNKIYPGQQIVIYGKKGTDDPAIAPGHIDGDPVDGPLSPGGWIPDTTDGSDSSPAGTGGSASSPTETGGTVSPGAGESYPVPPNDPTAGADNTGHPADGPLSPGGWTPDTTGGADSSPTETGSTASPGAGESYPVPPNDPTAGTDNTGHPVDGPLSPGGWTPDTTGGSGPSPAETGGAAPSGTGESYPLPPYPEPTSGTGSAGHPTDGAGGQKSDSSQTTATPNKPKNLPTVGSKNSGGAIAVTEHDQKLVPWMFFAWQEAENYGGINEQILDDSHNYHKLINKKATAKMSVIPWCASFVNYCFQKAGCPMSNNPRGSNSFVSDSNFKKIKMPTFGCLAIWWSPSKKQGHVGFVYGKDSKSDEIIVLGGNQNDSLNFMLKSDTSKGFVGFYFPKEYTPQLQSVLGVYDIVEINKEINYTYELKVKVKVT